MYNSGHNLNAIYYRDALVRHPPLPSMFRMLYPHYACISNSYPTHIRVYNAFLECLKRPLCGASYLKTDAKLLRFWIRIRSLHSLSVRLAHAFRSPCSLHFVLVLLTTLQYFITTHTYHQLLRLMLVRC